MAPALRGKPPARPACRIATCTRRRHTRECWRRPAATWRCESSPRWLAGRRSRLPSRRRWRRRGPGRTR
eukprot:4347963-Alexandrium_andersonii.AAC.1